MNSDTLNSLPVTVAKPITSAVTYTNNVEGDLRSQPPKSDHEYQVRCQAPSQGLAQEFAENVQALWHQCLEHFP